jgi:endonuclease/exonuclease/phosphatase family metal-dependent hydrolase
MAYAAKQQAVLSLHPDVVILQECSQKDIKASGATFSHWVGTNPHKGLAVLGFGNHVYSIDTSSTHTIPWFIPLRIDDMQLHILAVWSHVKTKQERYVRLTHQAIDHYQAFLEKGSAIIMGDFNSNTIWDKNYSSLSHTALVEKLAQLSLNSVYHHQTQEMQGKETRATFYLYRHTDKGYHMDYAFVSKDLLAQMHLLIPDPALWLTRSDHLPLILDIQS